MGDETQSSKNDGQNDLSTFSGRLNYLLDKTGFVKGRGRLKEFSVLINERNTKTRNWLQNNRYPRGPSMGQALDFFYEGDFLPSSIDKNELLIWLEKGDEYFENPFNNVKNLKINALTISRIKIYFSVYEEAKSVGMDLYQYTDEALESMFENIFKVLDEQKLSEIKDTDIQPFLNTLGKTETTK
jgi:hypothetical protein